MPIIQHPSVPGWWAVPLIPGEKKPAAKWEPVYNQEEPTHTEYPGPGFAILTKGIVVLDIDVDHSREIDHIKVLQAAIDLFPFVFSLRPPVVRTPSGGLHVYLVGGEARRRLEFIKCEELPQTAVEAGIKKLDWLGGSGFVVSAGTVFASGQYELITKGESWPVVPDSDWVSGDRLRMKIGLKGRKRANNGIKKATNRKLQPILGVDPSDAESIAGVIQTLLPNGEWETDGGHNRALGIASALAKSGYPEDVTQAVINSLCAADTRFENHTSCVRDVYHRLDALGYDSLAVAQFLAADQDFYMHLMATLSKPAATPEETATARADLPVEYEVQKRNLLREDIRNHCTNNDISLAYWGKSQCWYIWNRGESGVWEETTIDTGIGSFVESLFVTDRFPLLNGFLRHDDDPDGRCRFTLNPQNEAWIIKTLKTEYAIMNPGDFFRPDPSYLYFSDTVIHFTPPTYEIVSPAPEHRQFNRLTIEFAEDGGIGPTWQSLIDRYPEQWGMLWDYLKIMIWGLDLSEVFCIIVGPRNTGKSMIVESIRSMWGNAAGGIDLAKCREGDRFFGSSLIGKRVGINGEIITSQWTTEGISWLKSVTGGEGVFPVERKFQDAITYDFRPLHLLFSANQLPKLPDNGTDAEAIYRRCIIIVMDKLLSDSEIDLNFCARLKEELPSLVRLALDEGADDFWANRSREDHIKKTAALWAIWTTPMLKIVQDMYARSSGVEVIGQIEVMNEVKAEMTMRGLSYSSDDTQFKRVLSQCLMTMGIDSYVGQHNMRKTVSYRPIVRKTTICNSQPPIDPDPEPKPKSEHLLSGTVNVLRTELGGKVFITEENETGESIWYKSEDDENYYTYKYEGGEVILVGAIPK